MGKDNRLPRALAFLFLRLLKNQMQCVGSALAALRLRVSIVCPHIAPAVCHDAFLCPEPRRHLNESELNLEENRAGAAELADVSITIPVFNQEHYTAMCLDSLRRSGIAEEQIVVVDNGSTDGTPALLARYRRLTAIRNPTNRGCGGAWTQGAQARNSLWTVVLNNDVVLPPRWLEGLLDFAGQEGFDVVSPAMCEGELDYDLPAYADEFTRKMRGVRRVGALTGVCFMVHGRVFQKVGYFVDDLRLGGYEDDEFFRRCRKAGFRVAQTGRSFLHHFGSMTQKAIKAAMNQPRASLGDRKYYLQKYHITWIERKRRRWWGKLRSAYWRWSERSVHGRTLLCRREGGAFVWR